MNSPLVLAIVCLVHTGNSATAQGRPGDLVGTWQVVSRIDRDSLGCASVEPTLGREPQGYLIYDAAGHVAAQLMAPRRSASACGVPTMPDANNSTYICAYDAYFGCYEIDSAAGIVVHVLDGALTPRDVGRRLTRRAVVR